MAQTIQKIGRPQNLYMEALHAIKDAIFRGDFAPGQALPSEKELCVMLGVSRPVLREALRALQIQGFLDVRRGSRGGTYVTDLSNISIKDNLEDLLRTGRVSMDDLTQARLLLEPEVFRLAARKATAEQLAELEKLVREANQTRELKLKIKRQSDFHRLVAVASGSSIYLRFMQIIFDFIEVFATTLQTSDFEVHDEKDHAAIFEALSRRDGERAAALAKSHAEKVTHGMIKLEKKWLKALEQ
jgi:GntR family transcriptional repressor for pyruvate dehydrogenase complex